MIVAGETEETPSTVIDCAIYGAIPLRAKLICPCGELAAASRTNSYLKTRMHYELA
ncbi:hypothetical protein [Sphingobium agri]|uniref:hypothetical protein n=1 Tax=Sphingobium sp. GCM10012300 TaxID=3317347 RepID=UPI0036D40712